MSATSPQPPPTMTELGELFAGLAVEADRDVPTVRLVLEDGRTLDVFRAERVREHPIAWRTRGFVGDIRPAEFVAVLMGTTDGRAIVMASPADAGSATLGGQAVVGASAAARRLADLADLIARRVRDRFAPRA